MSWSPTLRKEIEVKPREEGGLHLYDPVTDRQIDITAPSAALVERLDGVTPLGTVLDELVAGGQSAERLDRTLRTLQALTFLTGSGERIVARLSAIRGGEPIPHSVLAGARFECQGSGQCCQNYVFGPLTDEDIARIEALDIQGAFPGIGPGPYWGTRERKDGRVERYLLSPDDRCLFLQDDHRCGLHAKFGADSKPGLCRMYPLEQYATVDGIRLYDKGSCATFATSARSGPTLAEQLPKLLPLLADRHGLYHPIVQLEEGLPLDYGYWLGFADLAMRHVDRGEASAPAALSAIAAGARRFAQRLEAYPLGPGEPDATLLALVGEAPSSWLPAAPDLREAGAKLRGLCGDLLEVLASGIHARVNAPGGRWWSARLVREATQVVHLAQGAAARLADPELVLDAYYAEVASVTTDDPSVDEVLRLSLRQQLFGSRMLVDNRVDAGMLRLALIQILATTGARMLAVGEGRKTYRAADLSYAHMLATRTLDLDGPEAVMVARAAETVPILDALPLLVP
jgi:Fe-S-cluster containining protein